MASVFLVFFWICVLHLLFSHGISDFVSRRHTPKPGTGNSSGLFRCTCNWLNYNMTASFAWAKIFWLIYRVQTTLKWPLTWGKLGINSIVCTFVFKIYIFFCWDWFGCEYLQKIGWWVWEKKKNLSCFTLMLFFYWPERWFSEVLPWILTPLVNKKFIFPISTIGIVWKMYLVCPKGWSWWCNIPYYCENADFFLIVENANTWYIVKSDFF